MKENPILILNQLESYLISEGFVEGCPALGTVSSLRSALRDSGYKDPKLPPVGDSSSYTHSRASTLRDLSVKLRSSLSEVSSPNFSHSDRASALVAVSNSYLQLAHAFKVDSKVWKLAQDDLVPILSAATDENSLDYAISSLSSHLDAYIKSLDSWLKK